MKNKKGLSSVVAIVSILIVFLAITGVTIFALKSGKNNDNNEIKNSEVSETNKNEKEVVDISKVELKEYEAITEDGVILDKRIIFNGYEFVLGVELDEFFRGTKSAAVDEKKLNKLRENPYVVHKYLECYLMDGDNRIEFALKVSRNDAGKIVIDEIIIYNDAMFANSDTIQNPNIVSCDFKFLGGHDIKDSFLDISKDIIEFAKNNPEETGFHFDYTSVRGGDFSISGTVFISEDNPDFYAINTIQITNIF